MNEKEILPLFSKPVFKTSIDVKGIDLKSVKWSRNNENWTSMDHFILKSPGFEHINEQIYNCVCEYFYGIMKAKSEIEIYITESWVNKTEKGQTHHKHWHPNSILSGVLYIDCDGESGAIKFTTSQYDTIEYEVDEPNIYNGRAMGIIPFTGNLLIFPSGLEHAVETHKGKSPRYSLSFNTFIRGNINSTRLLSLGIR
jgi:uncharacterized protein (TIGR02466 family)